MHKCTKDGLNAVGIFYQATLGGAELTHDK